MATLRNAAMDKIVAILDCSSMASVASFIIYVYQSSSTAATPMRALAIQQAAQNLTPELLTKMRFTSPPKLFFDMAMAHVKYNDIEHNSDRYDLTDSAKYHVGIPELEDDMISEELEGDLEECLEPEIEEENEQLLTPRGTCGDEFELAEGNEIEEDEIVVESQVLSPDFSLLGVFEVET